MKRGEGEGYFERAEEPPRERWSGGYRVAERQGTLLLGHRDGGGWAVAEERSR